MSGPIRRYVDTQTVSVDTSVAATEEIRYENFAGGQIHVPSGSSITSLTWHSSNTSGGTYEAAYDKDGTAVTQTVAADRAYPIPVALFGAAVIKAVGDTAGTIHVSLKG